MSYQHPCPQCGHRGPHVYLDVFGEDCDAETQLYECKGCVAEFEVPPHRQVAGIPIDEDWPKEPTQ